MATTKTEKTLKAGVRVVTYHHDANSRIPHPYEEKYYYYQGKELAHLMKDGVLYWNSKYWRKPEIREELKDIYSVIRRRSKATQFSEYMNL